MRRQKRQDQILDDSVKLFFEHGFDKLSVSDLAGAMAVSRGTFYLHFKSKRDVFLALIERFQCEFCQAISARSAAFNALGGVDFYVVSACLFKHRYFLSVVLTQGHSLETDLLDKSTSRLSEISQILKTGVETLVARGIFRPIDLDMAVLFVTGFIKEAILKFISQDDESFTHAHTRFLLDVILRAFLSRSSVVANAVDKDSKGSPHLMVDGFLSQSIQSETIYS